MKPMSRGGIVRSVKSKEPSITDHELTVVRRMKRELGIHCLTDEEVFDLVSDSFLFRFRVAHIAFKQLLKEMTQ